MIIQQDIGNNASITKRCKHKTSELPLKKKIGGAKTNNLTTSYQTCHSTVNRLKHTQIVVG